jgi:hypothetical protein
MADDDFHVIVEDVDFALFIEEEPTLVVALVERVLEDAEFEVEIRPDALAALGLQVSPFTHNGKDGTLLGLTCQPALALDFLSRYCSTLAAELHDTTL